MIHLMDESEGAHTHTDAIRDHVFPVFEFPPGDAPLTHRNFRGTGFMIGVNGFALTAAHVAEGEFPLRAFVVIGSAWIALEIDEVEHHPTEDVAVMRIRPPSANFTWTTIIQGVADRPRSSFPYMLWGYPEDTVLEQLESTASTFRPDLIYSEGHVRRIVRNVPMRQVHGTAFLELSQVAGRGCSGAPVLGSRGSSERWALAGVYVGERLDDRSTSVGFAARITELLEWSPRLIGHALPAEISAA
jgi:S1-C subfamily serine protease